MGPGITSWLSRQTLSRSARFVYFFFLRTPCWASRWVRSTDDVWAEFREPGAPITLLITRKCLHREPRVLMCLKTTSEDRLEQNGENMVQKRLLAPEDPRVC